MNSYDFHNQKVKKDSTRILEKLVWLKAAIIYSVCLEFCNPVRRVGWGPPPLFPSLP